MCIDITFGFSRVGKTLFDLSSPEDTLPGQFRMTYLFFNGTKGSNGYEVGFATSDDLLNWDFNKGVRTLM